MCYIRKFLRMSVCVSANLHQDLAGVFCTRARRLLAKEPCLLMSLPLGGVELGHCLVPQC